MKLQYTKASIGRVESLAQAISTDTESLIRITSDADKYFDLKERKEKPNGTYRDIYAVRSPLKDIQVRIVKQIIHGVDYPMYLQGSIKDRAHPRSDIANAQLHVNRRLVIRMDITNFFPSVRVDQVLSIWKNFFRFSPDVSSLLADLTTLDGFLPQGAPTSPGLANLVFWDVEPGVVDRLEKEGFYYSRYVDDVTISTDNFVEMRHLESIISRVFGMFKMKNVLPNRDKLKILTNSHALQVHNLNVNAERPTMPKIERSKIRAAVKNCEEMALGRGRYAKAYEKLWLQTSGRVQRMMLLHYRVADKYRYRLEAISPMVPQDMIVFLEQKLASLEAMAMNYRYTQKYRQKHQFVYRMVQRKMQFEPESLRSLWLRLKGLL